MPVTTRRFHPEIAEGITRCSPPFQVPSPCPTVRVADFCAVLFEQCLDRDVSVHDSQHFRTVTVEANQRHIIVERGKPVFVVLVLVGNQIGDTPDQEI